MNRLAAVLLLCTSAATATELKPIASTELAMALVHSQLVAERADLKIFKVPERIDDCWGTITSCPDIRLYIAFDPGVLQVEPVIYRLPNAKAWAFDDWFVDVNEWGFTIYTDIPGANIEGTERENWKTTKYKVTVEQGKVTYESR